MSRDISLLHPTLQECIKKIKKKFPDILITETYRTVKEQDILYAKGRTSSGNIVTNAKGKGYKSQHQWGIAFDFCKNVKGHEYDDSAYFRKVAKYAKRLGLAWGGDWKSIKDTPHIYMPQWGATTSRLKKLYGNPNNFKKTWKTKNVSRETLKKENKYYPKFKMSATGLVDGLNSISVESSFSFRKKIALANGYKDYAGTSVQNINLYTKGKKGVLIRAKP